VRDQRQTIGYRELGERANRLAHQLRALGIGPDDLVGVCLPRSTDLAVALLAVWQAGAAYVPLDPNHPRERTGWVLQDTGAAVVLTERSLVGLVEAEGVRPLLLDELDLSGFPAEPPAVRHTPQSLAYVIYTSGSTGRPKGVAVTHGGIANRVAWTVRVHRLGAEDRVLQKTSIGFDAAGWEVFGPLSSGGTVVMAPPGVERDPAAMVRTVAEHRVTVLQVVPSVLRLLVEEPGWADCTALRLLFSAGEPLHAELCQQLLAKAPAVEVWNTYGPTECAIDVTAHRFDPVQQAGPVLIGRPLTGLRLLVLDPAGGLAPIGVPGELHVGGVGVARGYLGRPDLTAEKFVPDPYGPPGERLYRTGDRVRWRADGSLEYFGRLDQQVKVNGVRIEPGEIEGVLLTHPDVRGAAVVAFKTASGVGRLAAYLTVKRELSTERLRAFLRERLPEYLVPSVFVTLDAFPLSPSGKLDRIALPAPTADATPGRPAYLAPRTDTERAVAEVWAAVLETTAPIGAHDDFFQLGGYSLLLTRLAQRLRAATGRQVAMADLFAASTVAAQAQLLAADEPQAVPITRVDRGGPLPLTAGQRRIWFLDQLNPGSSEYTVPVLLPLPQGATAAVVARALAALGERHEALRTRYPLLDGHPVQRVGEPGPVELTAAGDAEPVAAVRAEIARGFDLTAGPVWRALLLERHLLLTIHHIACDGWSVVLLRREFAELCAAFAAGREPQLAPLELGYPDFAVWQHEHWLPSAQVAGQLAYWKETLAGVRPLRLPTDHPRPARRAADGAVCPVHLPAGTVNGLVALGRERGATPFMTLLTVWHLVLAQLSGDWDLTIGTPVAGRVRPETHPLVGCFLNSVVLRARLSPELSFEQAVDRVRTVALGAFGHQDLPFEQVVEEVQPNRDLSRTPLYQALFDLQDDGVTGVAADAADLTHYQVAWHSTPTDLALVLRPEPDGAVGGMLEYATALYEPRTAADLAAAFAALAARVLDDPAAPVGAVDPRTGRDHERAALPWNEVTETAAPLAELTAYLAPRDPFEERLAELWAEALGHPRVGVYDNFFALGGNSLLAATVTAAARAEFEIELPVAALFDGPTVEQWARAVEGAIRAEIDLLTEADLAEVGTRCDITESTTVTKGQPA
jgi:amino acid adenylation domain-containing protein